MRGPQLRASLGVERGELTCAGALKHEPAGRRQRAAVRLSGPLDAPDLALLDRIPGDQPPIGVGQHLIRIERRIAAEVRAEIGPHSDRIERLGRAVDERRAVDRQVDPARLRAIRHRMPGVHAVRIMSGQKRLARLVIARLGSLDGTAGLEIDMRCPCDLGDLLRGDQLAAGRVEDIKETVLRRLHQHAPLDPVDDEIRDCDLLRRRVVPRFARRALVVPDVGAVIRIERDDRGQEQVVALALAAERMVPWRAVAGADVEQIELGIIGHRVPHGAAAADPPPLAAPSLCGHLENRALEALRRIAGHGIEAPRELAGCRIVGRHVAAHAELGAAVADQHLAFDDTRRAGDRIGLAAVDGVDVPHGRAGRRIERNQPAVDRADIDLALPHRDPAVDDIAARIDRPAARHFGVVAPQRRARDGVERLDLAPRGRDVEDAVDHQRRGFLAALGVEVRIPCEAELADVLRRDLIERAEALLGIGAPMREPLAGLAIGVEQPLGIDVPRDIRSVGGRGVERGMKAEDDPPNRCEPE